MLFPNSFTMRLYADEPFRLVWNLDELADLRRVAVDNEIIGVHSEKSYWGGL